MRKKILPVLFLFVMAMVGASTAHAEAVTVTISCYGHSETCVEWHHSGSNVWHRIGGVRIWEDPWGNLARTCPTGSDSSDNVFFFTPYSTTTGTGFVGCPVCASESANRYTV